MVVYRFGVVVAGGQDVGHRFWAARAPVDAAAAMAYGADVARRALESTGDVCLRSSGRRALVLLSALRASALPVASISRRHGPGTPTSDRKHRTGREKSSVFAVDAVWQAIRVKNGPLTVLLSRCSHMQTGS